MAARAQAAGRAGGRFAQFKLVLLGEDHSSNGQALLTYAR